jgi:hypothetical protein
VVNGIVLSDLSDIKQHIVRFYDRLFAERLRCGIFCRGGIGEEFKFHLVSWPKVCIVFNRALLGK